MTIQTDVAAIAERFSADRPARQLRRHLDPEDFRALAEAGFLHTGVPREMGGLWSDIPGSTRGVAELLRVLAKGDPSVALVAAMHPAVLSFWLTLQDPPAEFATGWSEQQRIVAQTALDGAWWGTITSEPGSGGDVGRSRTQATRRPGGYSITGQKHFGSGSGIASYMITTAVAEGEDAADWFYLDLRDTAWDGSNGMKLIAEWDGHGMIATQSHAFQFTDFPVTRLAWPGNLRAVSTTSGAIVSSVFTAVIVGVVQSAVEAARAQLTRRAATLAPFEQTEWVRVENEAWLIDQAYEGMLQSVERKGAAAALDTLHAKLAVSELSESVTSRICRVIGGGSFHRSSPFGWAFEDVRALGFLRPPWVFEFDSILNQVFPK
ncbi:MAG: acyl-CoA dehydrogenase family protein [Gammaproteobacteria bacterium]